MAAEGCLAVTAEEWAGRLHRAGPGPDLAVVDARLGAGLELPAGIPILLLGADDSGEALSGWSDVTVLEEPVSIAALIRAVAGLRRHSGRVALR